MRAILIVLSILLVGLVLPACTVIVDGELSNKADDMDAGPDGPRCDNTQQCLMLPDELFNCSLECINRVCVETTAGTPDGTVCGGSGGTQICVDNACVMRRCGDGYVDRTAAAMPIPEYCDDGNMVDGDGCDSNCTRSCVPPAPANCSDSNPCNGEEMCVSAMGLCRATRALDEGATCTTSDSMPGTCQQGTCVAD